MKRIALPTLSRDAKLLLAVSAIFAVSFGGIQMLLKVLYILRLGHGPEYVGLFGASSALAYTMVSIPSGALGERLGTKRVMFIGGILVTIGMGLLPFVERLPGSWRYVWPIASQMVMTGGWSLLNVNIVPALMLVTTAQNRNGAFALSNALRNLGTLLGTIAGGVLPGLFAGILSTTLSEPGPYRYGLWVSAVLGLAGLVPIACVRLTKQTCSTQQDSIGSDPFPFLAVALLVLHIFAGHGGWATCQAFWNAYMDRDLHLATASIGLITAIAQSVAVAASLLTPRLARRRGNGWAMMVTSLAMGLTFLPLAFIPHWAAASVGRLGQVALEAMWLPALQVYQMERVSARWRALAYGVSSMAMGFSFAAISLGSGYLIAAAGYRSAFLMGAGLCVAGAAVMWGIIRKG